jgi:hypothetical protein
LPDRKFPKNPKCSSHRWSINKERETRRGSTERKQGLRCGAERIRISPLRFPSLHTPPPTDRGPSRSPPSHKRTKAHAHASAPPSPNPTPPRDPPTHSHLPAPARSARRRRPSHDGQGRRHAVAGRRGGHRPLLHRGARHCLVLLQHRRATAQQVPPQQLRLQVPHLPHHVPHVRLRPALLRRHRLAPRRAHAACPLPPPARQDRRAQPSLLRLRRLREHIAAVPPRLLQPGRRRHHALLHRRLRLSHDRQARVVDHLPHPRARGHRRRHRQRSKLLPIPPLIPRFSRSVGVRAGSEGNSGLAASELEQWDRAYEERRISLI